MWLYHDIVLSYKDKYIGGKEYGIRSETKGCFKSWGGVECSRVTSTMYVNTLLPYVPPLWNEKIESIVFLFEPNVTLSPVAQDKYFPDENVLGLKILRYKVRRKGLGAA